MLARASDDTRVGITGIGAYLPETVLGNDTIGERLGVSSDWIVERSGILERRIAAPEETTTSLAVEAARAALGRASADPATVDVVIVATGTPDALTPATAARVAAAIGAAGAAAYDVSAACTGFIYALAQAHALIVAGLARRVLVIGAEVLSRVTDWHDPGTAILFGDGSGAAVVERVREGGFLGFELGCDGTRADDLMLPAGGTIFMNGMAVYRFSTREVPESVERSSGAMRADHRRRRPLRAAPVEHADNREHVPEARASARQGSDEHRSCRQHLGCVDPARSR